MTAPDPGLTDLIAAALVRSSPNGIDTFDLLPYHRQEAWRVRAREVALVVEQHTNGRIAELEAEVEHWKARSQYNYDCGMVLVNEANARAEKAEATIARVEAAYNAVAIYRVDHELYGDDAYDNLETIDRQSIRAALEGEQR